MNYQTFEYPYASKLNDSLFNHIRLEIIRLNLNTVQGGGHQTHQHFHKRELREVDILTTWITNLIPQACKGFVYSGEEEEGDPSFTTTAFEIDTCWGIIYNKGEGVVKHNHFPYALSFVYFVKTPPRSSPFILEGKRIKAEEGKLIIFLSHQFHRCPPTKSDGRCIIAGNIKFL